MLFIASGDDEAPVVLVDRPKPLEFGSLKHSELVHRGISLLKKQQLLVDMYSILGVGNIFSYRLETV